MRATTSALLCLLFLHPCVTLAESITEQPSLIGKDRGAVSTASVVTCFYGPLYGIQQYVSACELPRRASDDALDRGIKAMEDYMSRTADDPADVTWMERARQRASAAIRDLPPEQLLQLCTKDPVNANDPLHLVESFRSQPADKIDTFFNDLLSGPGGSQPSSCF